MKRINIAGVQLSEWIEIIQVVLDKEGFKEKTSFAWYLFETRNKVIFHYDRAEIGRGFLRKFTEKNKSFSNRNCYYALGDTMESIRFAFSDAAMEGFFASSDNDDFIFFNQAIEYANKINISLSSLLREYINGIKK